MLRVPSRKLRRSKPQGGLVLVVYEPIYLGEATAVEENVRACFQGWCGLARFSTWRHEPAAQTLFTGVETTCSDADQITAGLMYPAWDALEHFCSVTTFLDPFVWAEPLHRGGESDYQVYVEDTRLEADLLQVREMEEEGRIPEARGRLRGYLEAATTQYYRGAPWSERFLAYYQAAMREFEIRHSAP